MSFQIEALDMAPFRPLFEMSTAELAARQAVRVRVDECPGTPCRVSLEDARIGEEVLLVNYQHQPADSPYQSSHGIFIRPGVARAVPGPGDVPKAIFNRMISLRGFDSRHHIIEAAIATGEEISATIDRLFSNVAVTTIHLHNAGPGCYAALVNRVE